MKRPWAGKTPERAVAVCAIPKVPAHPQAQSRSGCLLTCSGSPGDYDRLTVATADATGKGFPRG